MTVELLIKEIKITDLAGLRKVEKVLYACGKYMAEKYDLHHWDNSHIKNMAILFLCTVNSRVYLALDENQKPVSTFQTKPYGDALSINKGGTVPECQGKGVYGKVLDIQKKLTKDGGYSRMICEIYAESTYAIQYHMKKGYKAYGTTETKKYKLIKMEMEIV